MGSLFITGLLNEEEDSLSTQLSLWHHLTLRNILQRKFTGWLANSDHLGDFLQERSQSVSKSDTANLRAWKLNEIMLFLKLPLPERVDLYSLNAIGIEIEVQSTALLRKIDKEFKGTSPDEMVIHLLIKIIKNFSEQFSKKDNQTQEKIVQKVLDILQSMPKDQQAILKSLLSIEEFSSDVVRDAIFDHTLATALGSFMMMVRYTVYYEIAKIALVISGAATFYLARPYLQPLIPLVLFLFSPIAVGTIGIGLTWWTDVYTNRQIQSFLLPVMVMSSIIASVQTDIAAHPSASTTTDTTSSDQNISNFIDFYNTRSL